MQSVPPVQHPKIGGGKSRLLLCWSGWCVFMGFFPPGIFALWDSALTDLLVKRVPCCWNFSLRCYRDESLSMLFILLSSFIFCLPPFREWAVTHRFSVLCRRSEICFVGVVQHSGNLKREYSRGRKCFPVLFSASWDWLPLSFLEDLTIFPAIFPLLHPVTGELSLISLHSLELCIQNKCIFPLYFVFSHLS